MGYPLFFVVQTTILMSMQPMIALSYSDYKGKEVRTARELLTSLMLCDGNPCFGVRGEKYIHDRRGFFLRIIYEKRNEYEKH